MGDTGYIVKNEGRAEDHRWRYGGVLRDERRRPPGRSRWEVATVPCLPDFDASPSLLFFSTPKCGSTLPTALAPSSSARVPLAEIPTRVLTAHGKTAQALETASRPLAVTALPVFMWPCLTVAASPPPRLMLLLRSAGPAGYVATAPLEASRENPSGESFRAPATHPLPNRR